MGGYKIIDPANGQRVSVATYLTRNSAERAITEWQNRHDRGGRPDIGYDLLMRVRVVEEA